MKLNSSSSSDRCNHPHEKLTHLLYECPIVQSFWQKVTAFWNERRSESVTLNVTDIIYAYKPESGLFCALNHFLLIAKHHIFPCWLNNVSPCLEIFDLILNDKILCEERSLLKIILNEIQNEMSCTVCVNSSQKFRCRMVCQFSLWINLIYVVFFLDFINVIFIINIYSDVTSCL